MRTSIKQAAKRCRQRFAGVEVGAAVWFCHHGRRIEVLTEPPENRIAYILLFKPEHERVVRLDAFRPVLAVLPSALNKALAALIKARAALVVSGDAYNKARETFNKAWETFNKARETFNKAWATHGEARATYDKARATYDKARATYDKAGAAQYKARATYNKAWGAYAKALGAYDKAGAPEIDVLFAIECADVPWDGTSLVFPKRRV